MKTFREWLKLKEGLWLSDSNAEQTSGGVRAKRKSKDSAPGGGAAAGGGGGMGGGMPPMGGAGGGMSMPPK